MKINELQLPKWFEDLFDLSFCEIEVEGADIKTGRNVRVSNQAYKAAHVHCSIRGANTWWKMETPVSESEIAFLLEEYE